MNLSRRAALASLGGLLVAAVTGVAASAAGLVWTDPGS